MSQFFNHAIDLTKTNINKLKNGLASDIKHVNIGKGLPIHLEADNHNKVMKAFNAGKNVRLTLSPAEMAQNREKNGEGFGRFLHNKLGVNVKKLKKTGRQIAKVAIPIIANVAGQALGDATGNPMLGALAGEVGANMAQKAVGNGLFQTLHKAGIKGVKGHAKKAAKQVAKQAKERVKKAVKEALPAVIEVVKNKAFDVTGSKELGDAIGNFASQHANNAIEQVDNLADRQLNHHFGEAIGGSVRRRGLQRRMGRHYPKYGGAISEYDSFNKGYNYLLPMSSPAMHPFREHGSYIQPSLLDIARKVKGGSFVASGY